MLVITGGAGFIGSNIVQALSRKKKEIVVVDDLTDGRKFENLLGADVADYVDKDDFIAAILQNMETGLSKKIDAIIHNGAISSTTNFDGKKVMDENYEYSKILLNYCHKHNISFIYASSASVYGANKSSIETQENKPLNMYAYSKLLFDNYVRTGQWNCDVIGLRYFNVYGPGEQFKGSQASPFFRYYKTLKNRKPVELFNGDNGFGGKAEDTKRDFVYIDDVVRVILWMLKYYTHFEKPKREKFSKHIFNVGTGNCHTFEEVADNVVAWCLAKKHIDMTHLVCKGFPFNQETTEEEINWIHYTPFPLYLKGRSQPYTCANLTKLREAGYKKEFISIEDGCKRYMKWLDENSSCRWD